MREPRGRSSSAARVVGRLLSRGQAAAGTCIHTITGGQGPETGCCEPGSAATPLLVETTKAPASTSSTQPQTVLTRGARLQQEPSLMHQFPTGTEDVLFVACSIRPASSRTAAFSG